MLTHCLLCKTNFLKTTQFCEWRKILGSARETLSWKLKRYDNTIQHSLEPKKLKVWPSRPWLTESLKIMGFLNSEGSSLSYSKKNQISALLNGIWQKNVGYNAAQFCLIPKGKGYARPRLHSTRDLYLNISEAIQAVSKHIRRRLLRE